MMDFMEEFEKWLPEWSEKKMQPIPTRDHPDRWSIAWHDFMTEYLAEKKDEIIAEYKAMQFKTKADLEKKEEEVEEEDIEPILEPESPKPLTEWEKVQAMLNKKSSN